LAQFQTVLITVFSGLFLFILSQFFLKFILEPMVEVRKVIGKISSHLVLYAYRFSNVVETKELYENEELRKSIMDVSTKTRTLASELQGAVQVVPLYSLFSSIGFIPSQINIQDAISNLIGLSNSLSANSDSRYDYIHFNTEKRDEINKCLKIKVKM
jgi:hypothetical protein